MEIGSFWTAYNIFESNLNYDLFIPFTPTYFYLSDCHLSAQATVTCANIREKLSRMLSLQIDTTFPHLSPADRIMRATKATLLLPSLYVSFYRSFGC